MKIEQAELKAVLQLDGAKRYEYFIKKVADWEEVWGLYQDGWALATDDDGNSVFPLWPAKEYAKACASADWSSFEPSVIELEDLLSELLPKLSSDNLLCGVFYTPSDKGVLLDPVCIMNSLREEMEQYQ